MKQIRTLLVVGTLLLCSCTHPVTTERVLREAGYTNINVGGYAWFAGDEGDTFATKFTATSPTGAKVRGVVTKGPFKANTIRLR